MKKIISNLFFSENAKYPAEYLVDCKGGLLWWPSEQNWTRLDNDPKNEVEITEAGNNMVED